MKHSAERLDSSWIMFATMPFPVPLSPRSSTGMSNSAICRIWPRMSFITELSATKPLAMFPATACGRDSYCLARYVSPSIDLTTLVTVSLLLASFQPCNGLEASIAFRPVECREPLGNHHGMCRQVHSQLGDHRN